MDYKELIMLSKKAADEWRNDHVFYQAGALIDSLCASIETLLAERDESQDKLLDIKATLDMYGGEYGITSAFQKAAERDAAVEELHGRCIKCKHFSVGILDFPCTDCKFEGGANDRWEWRGPKKGDTQ